MNRRCKNEMGKIKAAMRQSSVRIPSLPSRVCVCVSFSTIDQLLPILLSSQQGDMVKTVAARNKNKQWG